MGNKRVARTKDIFLIVSTASLCPIRTNAQQLKETHADSWNTSKWRKHLDQFDNICAAFRKCTTNTETRGKYRNKLQILHSKYRNTLQIQKRAANTETCSKYRNTLRIQKRIANTETQQIQKTTTKVVPNDTKSAEHRLEWSVYHLFLFMLWISDFCYCSTLRMHTSQDLAEWKSGILSVILMISEEPA